MCLGPKCKKNYQVFEKGRGISESETQVLLSESIKRRSSNYSRRNTMNQCFLFSFFFFYDLPIRDKKRPSDPLVEILDS